MHHALTTSTGDTAIGTSLQERDSRHVPGSEPNANLNEARKDGNVSWANSLSGSGGSKYEISQPFLSWTIPGHSSGDRLAMILDIIVARLRQGHDYHTGLFESDAVCLTDLETRSWQSPEMLRTRSDEVLEGLRKDIFDLKPEVLSASKSLICQFVPLDHDHSLVKAFWILVGKIFQVVEELTKDCEDEALRHDNFSVRIYLGEDKRSQECGIPSPSHNLAECTTCHKGFLSRDSGHRHLRKKHFGRNGPRNYELWLTTATEVLLETRLHIVTSVLRTLVTAINEILDRAREIHEGVAVLGRHDNRIEEHLVTAFERIFIMYAYTARKIGFTMQALSAENVIHFLQGEKVMYSSRLTLDRAKILELTEQAMVGIMVSSEAGHKNGSFMLTPTQPHFLIAILASGLTTRRIMTMSKTHVDVHRMYREYTNYLHSQISSRPCKGLFPHIVALDDELGCLQKVIYWQLKFYNDLMRVLDPSSSQITTHKRVQDFELESGFLQRQIRKLSSRQRQVKEHQKHVQDLHRRLRHAIEIQEETDHHAIWVFTFVTVLFLPLSFVTSFFGMNVEGIRDMEQSQYMFWIVAIPITSAVIGVSLIYAYRWEKWMQAGRKWFEATIGSDRNMYSDNSSGKIGWRSWFDQIRGRSKAENQDAFELGLRTHPARAQTDLSRMDGNFTGVAKEWRQRRRR
ncbi:hypothetical protein Micbo1qcDRAFT_159003 [Microdochium bolleyi]|uniref:C2H2-type domain-containing protein n=1 Tax=Microdochium bolleyi TaxID=196109 RepID=A0A136JA54_9PEZI|nr:hypothetical protein Micbo1qcDRAFT_159003 [Microdochium bolleyi]